MRPPSTTVFTVLSLTAGAYAAIGPNADLVIANAVISPDGFARSYVAKSLFNH